MDDLAELALGNLTYAGFWVRFAAATLDALVILIVALGIGVAIGAAGRCSEFPRGRASGDLWPNVLGMAISAVYFAALESGPRCATYGKRAFHLQVLGAADLTRISFLRALGRWVGRFASTFLLMIGYLMQPFTPRKRALHDYIAGTVVVVQVEYSRTLVGRDPSRPRRAGDGADRRRLAALGTLGR